MKTRSIKYLVLPVLLLFILAVIFQQKISADSASGKPESTKNISLTIGGGKVNFVIEKYKNGDSYDFYLKKKSLIGRPASVKLSGFESDVSVCDQPVIKIDNNGQEAICLVSDVGVHSRNIEIIKYDRGNISAMPIKSGSDFSGNMISDVPDFSFKDVNNDGKIDLIIDQRNYDADPMTDAFQDSFLGTGASFVFDARANIQYNK